MPCNCTVKLKQEREKEKERLCMLHRATRHRRGIPLFSPRDGSPKAVFFIVQYDSVAAVRDATRATFEADDCKKSHEGGYLQRDVVAADGTEKHKSAREKRQRCDGHRVRRRGDAIRESFHRRRCRARSGWMCFCGVDIAVVGVPREGARGVVVIRGKVRRGGGGRDGPVGFYRSKIRGRRRAHNARVVRLWRPDSVNARKHAQRRYRTHRYQPSARGAANFRERVSSSLLYRPIHR